MRSDYTLARASLVLALACTLGRPLAAAGLADLLARVPGDASIVVVLERPARDAGLYTRFASELLFACGVDTPVAELARLGPGPLESAERVVVAGFGRRGKPSQTAALLEGELDSVYAATLVVGGPRSIVRLDARTLAAGDLPAVGRLGRPLSERSGKVDVASVVSKLPSVGTVRGAASPDWLDFGAEGKEHDACDVRGRSVSRSLAGIGTITFTAKVEGEVRLELAAEAGDPADAAILADAVRATLGSLRALARASGVAEIAKAMEGARATSADRTVRLDIAFSAAAMERLRRNTSSPRIFDWGLESARRERRENVREIFDLLALSEGDRAADIGAGSGFYTVRLARAVGPNGRVYAVDVDEASLAELRRRVSDGGVAQVEAIEGRPDDPRLAAGSVDAALIVNSYHEMPEHAKMLERIRQALRPGGRLLLIEPTSAKLEGKPRAEQEKEHVIAAGIVAEDLRAAGFEIVVRNDAFTQAQGEERAMWLILARRPTDEK